MQRSKILFLPPLSHLNHGNSGWFSDVVICLKTHTHQDPRKMMTKISGIVFRIKAAELNFWTVDWTSCCSEEWFPSARLSHTYLTFRFNWISCYEGELSHLSGKGSVSKQGASSSAGLGQDKVPQKKVSSPQLFFFRLTSQAGWWGRCQRGRERRLVPHWWLA